MRYGLKQPKIWIKTVSKKVANAVNAIHQPMRCFPLQLLALVMALTVAALVMWDPKHFAQAIGGFGPVIAPLMIWATCSAVMFGMGFVPHRWYWQVFFSPMIALPILLYVLALRFL